MKKSPARAGAKATPPVKPTAQKGGAATSRATQKVVSAAKTKDGAPTKLVRAVSTPRTAPTPKKLASKAATNKTTKSSESKVSVSAKTSANKVKATKANVTKTTTSKTASPQLAATKASTDATASPKTLRATKKRAPKDLAAQYGETAKAPRQSAVKKAPRKRRDAAARARLQQVIAPDDALLLRLARAGAISSSLAPASANERPPGAMKTRRSRNWEAHCGKCGKSASYRASAALCKGCGAILVRD